MLNWAKQFNTFCFLDNHGYSLPPHAEECLLAAGIKRSVRANAGNALQQLQSLIDERPSWLFGHLGYDLKEELGFVKSTHTDMVGFPDLFFFEPEVLLRFNNCELHIEAENADRVYQEIMSSGAGQTTPAGSPAIHQRLSRDEYLAIISRLREHILRGDCYEINFCAEFFASKATIDPLETYQALARISPNPFSALYRVNDQWLACASPERFLRKQGSQVLSQPIKGTSRRMQEEDKDLQSREELRNSGKDRSENVMIVDLVRNDLSRICEEGSVKVDELFGVYSFPQVHQMISTISGQLRKEVSFTDIIRATFPMGSMTGAPKKRVVELIEQYEQSARGIFSGALGYITPAGDFDLNVVIRSLMYNAKTGYLSFQAGSGITYSSDPLKEWDECLVKAEAIQKTIG